MSERKQVALPVYVVEEVFGAASVMQRCNVMDASGYELVSNNFVGTQRVPSQIATVGGADKIAPLFVLTFRLRGDQLVQPEVAGITTRALYRMALAAEAGAGEES